MSFSCLICIGSNEDREEHLLLARRELRTLFPTIRFAEEELTKPLFFRNPVLFVNQVAVFSTDAAIDEVVEQLKAIESKAGRRPEDKAEERVRLDIDLLSYDGHILKPKDMKRVYIIKGLSQL